MALTHDVTLTLRSTGTRIDTWDQYSVALDLFKPGEAFTFSLFAHGGHSLARDLPGQRRATAWRTLVREVKLYDRITVAIDGAPQFVGVIESAPVVDEGHGGAQLVISGRDVAGLAMEADADPRVRIRGASLQEALGRLFAPLGIPVVIGASAAAAEATRAARAQVATRRAAHADAAAAQRARTAELYGADAPAFLAFDSSAPAGSGVASVTSGSAPRRQRVDLAHPRPGEKVWQVAESVARRAGYMLWLAPTTDGTLALVVDVPNYEAAPSYTFTRTFTDDVQDPASNILRAGLDRSVRGVPTEVHVSGHAERGDAVAARLRHDHPNLELDRWDFVLRPRPTVARWVHARRSRTLAACAQVSARALSDAMAQSFRTVPLVVQGHGQATDAGMRLFALGAMARHRDQLCGLDESMLIQRVEFHGSRREGQTTRMVLGTQGMIVLTPETA